MRPTPCGDVDRPIDFEHKAAVAVGHTLLVTVYYLLLRRYTYCDFDPSVLDERLRKRTRQRALAQLHALGYDVTLTEHQPAA